MNTPPTLPNETERLLPVLIHIQTHLEDDLSLDALAERASLSPFHFHRIFRGTVGETVKQYVQRLRLERAAYLLRVQDVAVIDVAFTLGYHAHETFSRAFRRHFGVTPKEFRQSHRFAQHVEETTRFERPQPLNDRTTYYELSRVTVRTLDAIGVAFIRHYGAYVDADTRTFDRLIAWSQSKGLYIGDNLLIGIGHDDPNVTPSNKVRFDACIEVVKPIVPDGDIGYQTIPAGHYATVTYVGPYGHTMYEAYATLFHQMESHARYRLIGLPAVEIYRTTQINPDYALNQTDIYLPVEERRG